MLMFASSGWLDKRKGEGRTFFAKYQYIANDQALSSAQAEVVPQITCFRDALAVCSMARYEVSSGTTPPTSPDPTK